MESEKAKEIKKALECCIKNETENTCKYCEDCPAFDEEWVYEEGIERCDIDLWQKTLALINELESENDCKDIEISKQEYQIEKLKDRIAELEKENAKNANCFKQFAEKLIEKKVKLGERFNIYDIDEILKEFL